MDAFIETPLLLLQTKNKKNCRQLYTRAIQIKHITQAKIIINNVNEKSKVKINYKYIFFLTVAANESDINMCIIVIVDTAKTIKNCEILNAISILLHCHFCSLSPAFLYAF